MLSKNFLVISAPNSIEIPLLDFYLPYNSVGSAHNKSHMIPASGISLNLSTFLISSKVTPS